MKQAIKDFWSYLFCCHDFRGYFEGKCVVVECPKCGYRKVEKYDAAE